MLVRARLPTVQLPAARTVVPVMETLPETMICIPPSKVISPKQLVENSAAESDPANEPEVPIICTSCWAEMMAEMVRAMDCDKFTLRVPVEMPPDKVREFPMIDVAC